MILNLRMDLLSCSVKGRAHCYTSAYKLADSAHYLPGAPLLQGLANNLQAENARQVF